MWVSVRANVRVSSAARRSAREALQVCFLFGYFSKAVSEFHFKGKCYVQIAIRAGGFSAIVVVGMAVIGIAILYATFYVWLGVDTPGSMKVTDCKCQLSLLLDRIVNLSHQMNLLFPSIPILLCRMSFCCSVTSCICSVHVAKFATILKNTGNLY